MVRDFTRRTVRKTLSASAAASALPAPFVSRAWAAYPGLMGSYDYRIRADMVYFTTPENGAVFSTGSIAFSQSLPYNNFDNNISKLLANILKSFAKPGRLPGSNWTLEEKQIR